VPSDRFSGPSDTCVAVGCFKKTETDGGPASADGRHARRHVKRLLVIAMALVVFGGTRGAQAGLRQGEDGPPGVATGERR
jgi:hypothetical protein